MKKTNSERFLNAYNTLDQNLRTIYGLKRSMTFSDVIRRCVMLNATIRQYEEDLINYGRLRNAIIHQSNSKYTIAEPHDDVVDKMERISELIAEPPVAIDRVGNRDVITVDGSISIGKAMELIQRTGYSNLPVYENGVLQGILNGRKLVDVLGARISEGVNLQEFVDNTPIIDVLYEMGKDYYFILADESLTIESAMNEFENNRKLLIILITKNGKENGKPLCLISPSDIIDMKKILDVY